LHLLVPSIAPVVDDVKHDDDASGSRLLWCGGSGDRRRALHVPHYSAYPPEGLIGWIWAQSLLLLIHGGSASDRSPASSCFELDGSVEINLKVLSHSRAHPGYKAATDRHQDVTEWHWHHEWRL
jgi:hypothetical protein